MTKRQTIIELASTLRDVTPAPIRGSKGRGRSESFSLEQSTIYRAGSYKQLEDALSFMHSRSKQYAIAGNSLGQLHWHFTQRYLASTRKPLPARQTNAKTLVLWDGTWTTPKPLEGKWWPCGGLYRTDPKGPLMVQVETWHPDVRHHKVELALDWLEGHLGRVWLPDWSQLSERAA